MFYHLFPVFQILVLAVRGLDPVVILHGQGPPPKSRRQRRHPVRPTAELEDPCPGEGTHPHQLARDEYLPLLCWSSGGSSWCLPGAYLDECETMATAKERRGVLE